MDNPENNLASEEFEDTKGINRKSKKDRQHNDVGIDIARGSYFPFVLR
jgi:hypothetical protein